MHEASAYSSDELAEVYDTIWAGRDDVELWLSLAADAGGPVLELGCGTGRVLLALARAGHDVTGIDLSPHMISLARAKAAAEPPAVRARISLSTDDMTSFALDRRYALITSPFGGFHHLLTVEDQLACLDRCRRHLAPGGRLVLDLFNPDPVPLVTLDAPPVDEEVGEPPQEVAWTGGRFIRWSMQVVGYDRSQQRNDCRLACEIVEADGTVRRLDQAFPLRYLFRFELEHLLARAGLRLVALYGDYDRSALADGSLGMIAVAAASGSRR